MKNTFYIALILSLIFTTYTTSQNSLDLSKMKSSFEKRRPNLDVMSANPSVVNLDYKPFTVITSDSIKIASWFIPNKLKKGTILMIHGFDMNKSHMLKRASFFYNNGYSVLLLDLRARGESGGNKANTGKKNALDVVAVYHHYKNNFASHGEVTIYGYSHGGRAAIFGASRIENIKQIILESPPYQLGESFKRQYRMPNAPQISEAPINKALTTIANIPVFLLIGDSDTAIIKSEAQTLIEYSKNPNSKYIVFKNTGHNVFSENNVAQYKKEIIDFISNN